MGYGDLGLFNGGRSSTPHSRRARRRGRVPDAALLRLAGLRPRARGASDRPLPAPHGRDRHPRGARARSDRPARATIADLFRSAGYATGLVGKWHNGALDARYHPNAARLRRVRRLPAAAARTTTTTRSTATAREVESDGRYLTDVFTERGRRLHRAPRAASRSSCYLTYNAPALPVAGARTRSCSAIRDDRGFTRRGADVYGDARGAWTRASARIDETLARARPRARTRSSSSRATTARTSAAGRGRARDRFNCGCAARSATSTRAASACRCSCAGPPARRRARPRRDGALHRLAADARCCRRHRRAEARQLRSTGATSAAVLGANAGRVADAALLAVEPLRAARRVQRRRCATATGSSCAPRSPR